LDCSLIALSLVLRFNSSSTDLKHYPQAIPLGSEVDDVLPVKRSFKVRPPTSLQIKKAMTWRILDTRTDSNGTPYFLFGSDSQTNPYTGDTDTSTTQNLLCIKKEGLGKPSVIPNTTTTPGGAIRGSWSGGKAMVVFDVPGTALSSKAEADKLCNYTGETTLGISGFQMAEFHDGNPSDGWVGWDFWADGSKVILNPTGTSLMNRRFWVSINDQPANPWP
jgi:hypothetical protein